MNRILKTMAVIGAAGIACCAVSAGLKTVKTPPPQVEVNPAEVPAVASFYLQSTGGTNCAPLPWNSRPGYPIYQAGDGYLVDDTISDKALLARGLMMLDSDPPPSPPGAGTNYVDNTDTNAWMGTFIHGVLCPGWMTSTNHSLNRQPLIWGIYCNQSPPLYHCLSDWEGICRVCPGDEVSVVWHPECSNHRNWPCFIVLTEGTNTYGGNFTNLWAAMMHVDDYYIATWTIPIGNGYNLPGNPCGSGSVSWTNSCPLPPPLAQDISMFNTNAPGAGGGYPTIVTNIGVTYDCPNCGHTPLFTNIYIADNWTNSLQDSTNTLTLCLPPKPTLMEHILDHWEWNEYLWDIYYRMGYIPAHFPGNSHPPVSAFPILVHSVPGLHHVSEVSTNLASWLSETNIFMGNMANVGTNQAGEIFWTNVTWVSNITVGNEGTNIFWVKMPSNAPAAMIRLRLQQ